MAGRWLTWAALQIPDRQLRELLQLFASWAERFGPGFYLCQGLMRLWCDCDWRELRNKEAGTGLLVDLLGRGLLIEHDRDGLHRRQATYWDLNLDRIPASLDPPTNGIAPLAQGSEQRLLSETEIGELLWVYGGYDGDAFGGVMESEGSAGGLAAA